MADPAATEPTEKGAEPAAGLLANTRRLGGTLAAIVTNRVELFLVELQEERGHLVQLLVLAVVALVLFILALGALTAAIVIYAGEEHRVAALLGVAAFYAGGGMVAARRLMNVMQRWESFPDTLNELKKDRDWLRPPP